MQIRKLISAGFKLVLNWLLLVLLKQAVWCISGKPEGGASHMVFQGFVLQRHGMFLNDFEKSNCKNERTIKTDSF
jgi:hypothetical protein